MIYENFFPDQASLLAALCSRCQLILEKSLGAHVKTSLLVSGGSTPLGLYRALSLCDLNWKDVSIALVDERWVDAAHAGSNETFIRESLLTNNASAAAFTGMKNEAASAALGMAKCEAGYQALAQPFSLTILGMGGDGHTASLFPEAQGLEAALDASNTALCAVINARPSEVTGELTERMTLTLSGLLTSQKIILLLRGDEKRRVYEKAKSLSETGDLKSMPISTLLAAHNRVKISVYWSP